MIPPSIRIKNGELPDEPGVYLYYDTTGTLLYVGKATSLKRRVGSYFTKAHNGRIAEMVGRIVRIEYVQTPTVIEALVLEANYIKTKKPYYNILLRDDKTFQYLVITNEPYPKPVLKRGLELAELGINPFSKTLSAKAKTRFLAVYGPYTSGPSLRKALDLIRKAIPWSICEPPEVTGKTRPCFNVHLKKCPGVCTGAISRAEYKRIIRKLMLFFEGKVSILRKQMEREMKQAAAAMDFERAAQLRNNLYALDHVKDIALISREDSALPFEREVPEGSIDLEGRIEAFDIAHISGTSAVAAMTVFLHREPAKALYRKFKIKVAPGGDDFASMEEVLRRRFARAIAGTKGWELPELLVIDGGEGQVAVLERVLQELNIRVPYVGIAKGFDRKQDRLVYDRADPVLNRAVIMGKPILQRVRDEAHRFAGSYHRTLRGKSSLGK